MYTQRAQPIIRQYSVTAEVAVPRPLSDEELDDTSWESLTSVDRGVDINPLNRHSLVPGADNVLLGPWRVLLYRVKSADAPDESGTLTPETIVGLLRHLSIKDRELVIRSATIQTIISGPRGSTRTIVRPAPLGATLVSGSNPKQEEAIKLAGLKTERLALCQQAGLEVEPLLRDTARLDILAPRVKERLVVLDVLIGPNATEQAPPQKGKGKRKGRPTSMNRRSKSRRVRSVVQQFSGLQVQTRMNKRRQGDTSRPTSPHKRRSGASSSRVTPDTD